ncbi:2-aminoethylphosphonate aminotransferase [Tolypothrix sp. PCC 7910]|uniref:2-aminoethylphosphonate aminotransferase n=1 Tax=Tolypothrix sp. PCC 7910 TaxID=2099387 RepID=UPI0014278E51|nr:2-aminoethylphosphonate aminotransferase [Tolypothrix sp. PCC 7910]QIR39094.1 2-aminoethylphosphonate aminotransferase [Tolypothrix sp. PCC 7910]
MTINHRNILLNPGPVTLSERVRQALLREDLCHREPEFAQLMLDIKSRLVSVYPEAVGNYEAIVLTGSGTCAVEAMLSSLISQSGKALIVTNGVYGERMAKMVKIHQKNLVVVTSSWEEPMNYDAVEQCLNQDSSFTHVVAVHHETTTGRLNDIAKLGEICRSRNVALLLDCVSSFGAENIKFSEWNLEACAATANKCLHGVPGLSFVLVKKSVFESRPTAASSLYLDLYGYHKQQLEGYSPFTQSVQVSYALQEALKELAEQGGWETRQNLYRNHSQTIQNRLALIGIETFLEPLSYSCVLKSYKLPLGYSYEYIHDYLKKSKFIIYAGQGGLEKKTFRIANMGNINNDDIEYLCLLLEKSFKRCQYD